MTYRIYCARAARLALAAASTVFAVPALAASADTPSKVSGQNTVVTEAPQTEVDTFELSTGVDYSVGKYGALADTSVVSVPVELKGQFGRLRLQAGVPWVSIKGPGQLVGGVVVSDPNSTSTVKRDGIGDVNVSAAYLLNTESVALPAFELGAGVKLPTAKDTIGTGETDYSATLSAYKSLSSTVMLFGSVGYSWLGSPAAYQLKDGITASGGLNLRPDEKQNYGVSVSYREPVAEGYAGQAVVSPYMTYRVSKGLGLTLYGMAGFNDASPRWGAGLRLSLFP
ncbi:outer membrane putative beta-barrel porin/alpha-amylase [Novosphingobium kunmingense]|uniref:Outer membrane putative beta-barrel porin/alpha-amylase n=1 Tax=Novosphingobium kunmingense TaxID=1211806 RepID=A0A2N0HKP7_9SPHN|nr:transporter [Novosphingobium kunmingense]PKB19448.1 outer membrane putative beta-barrel porin/alpha-amylase [Novosphingobium kunmingense]